MTDPTNPVLCFQTTTHKQGVVATFTTTTFDPYVQSAPTQSADTTTNGTTDGITRLRFTDPASGGAEVPVNGLRAPIEFTLPAPPPPVNYDDAAGGDSEWEAPACSFWDEKAGVYRCVRRLVLFVSFPAQFLASAGGAPASFHALHIALPCRISQTISYSSFSSPLPLFAPHRSTDGCGNLPSPRPRNHTFRWAVDPRRQWMPTDWNFTVNGALRCAFALLSVCW